MSQLSDNYPPGYVETRYDPVEVFKYEELLGFLLRFKIISEKDYNNIVDGLLGF